jgi:hypothetical protein
MEVEDEIRYDDYQEIYNFAIVAKMRVYVS